MTKLFFIDETNLDPAQRVEFYIAGGVFFDADRLREVHDMVEAARVANGFPPDGSLKFDTRSRPDNVTREQHKEAKRMVIDGAQRLGVRFMVYLTLHDIAAGQDRPERIKFGVNTLVNGFDKMLRFTRDVGFCVVDRLNFDNYYGFLREKFQLGTFEPPRRLNRVLGFASTCDGQSHAASLADVVLGAFRFCVNERERDIAAREMLPAVAQLLWAPPRQRFRENGIFLRPMNVAVQQHADRYIALFEHLNGLLAPRPPALPRPADRDAGAAPPRPAPTLLDGRADNHPIQRRRGA